MKRIYFTALILGLVTLVAQPGLAEDWKRTISVSGEGKATAPPDMATIHTGVVVQAADATEAVAANNGAIAKIMDVLKDNRIASKDVQTSNFDVQPEYKRTPRGEQPPEIVGYRVSNQLRVQVRNLPDLGKILDALVRAGSNQISGISFGIDDSTGVLNQARNRAVADARSRANLYAHAAGVKVGPVISISEQAANVPLPRFAGRMMAAEAAGSVPVATGEQEVAATVHMVFALESDGNAISGDDSQPANVNAAILDEVNASGVWFHAKKTAPLWAKRLKEDQAIKSLEGDVNAKAGDFLCRGAAGEFWPQSAERISEKYDPTDEVDADGFRKFLPNSEVMAAQVDRPFQVETSWGDLEGKAGDFILKSFADSEVEYPDSVWIVDKQLFADTYQRVSD